ncbi:MAG: hypothetical protein AB7G48_03330 [Nitrospiraceae bacterium]
MEGLPADLDIHAEVRTHVEGRVDIDEPQAAGLLDLAAERPGLERRENQLVVAPDELIRPALDLPPAHVEIQLAVLALFLSRLVDMFEGLERQHGGTDFAAFAVPHQLDFALVGKEEEAILLRQRLPLLNQLDEVALLGIGKVVFF